VVTGASPSCLHTTDTEPDVFDPSCVAMPAKASLAAHAMKVRGNVHRYCLKRRDALRGVVG
jgi:hypothetical protein